MEKQKGEKETYSLLIRDQELRETRQELGIFPSPHKGV